MPETRRQALQAVGASTLAALAGCAGLGRDPAPTYDLLFRSVDASPVEHALYEPPDDSLFGPPARRALAAILPTGRHTTYGYEPLPADAYVTHDGRYYQTIHTVTGRRTIGRTLVRATSVAESDVTADAVPVDRLSRPARRVCTILYNDMLHVEPRSGLLRGDAYVLRLPAERASELATGALDGRVVTIADSDSRAYRIETTRERIVEPANTVLAVEVADSREEFREVVFAARIDTTLEPSELSEPARTLLERAIREHSHTETAPLSDGFERLLADLGAEESSDQWQWLYYDDQLYEYALWISEPT